MESSRHLTQHGPKERWVPQFLCRLQETECSHQGRYIPRLHIDDLLDKLAKARYFSMLDLASGFWQIQMEPHSQEKTALVTPQGLFEFKVIPFGLTNVPAVF